MDTQFNTYLAESGCDDELVVFSEKGAQAGVGRLHGQVGEGEVVCVEEGKEAYPWYVVGACDQPDTCNVVVARPCLQAGDVLPRGLCGIVDDVLLLAWSKGCGGESEDIGEAGGVVRAADENGAFEAMLDLFEGGFDASGAAGEGGEAFEALRQGGEGLGEGGDEQREAQQVGAAGHAGGQHRTATPAQPRRAGDVQVEEVRVRHAAVLAGFGRGGNECCGSLSIRARYIDLIDIFRKKARRGR